MVGRGWLVDSLGTFAVVVGLLTVACGSDALRERVRWFEPRQVASLGTGGCVLLTNGQVACQYEGDAPTPALSERAIGLAQGGDAARCALLEGGRVACWGCSMSHHGAVLGFPTFANLQPRRAEATLAPVLGARQVALGGHGACALLASGSVTCWGGVPLGDGVYYTSYGICRKGQQPRQLDLPPARRIAVALDNQVCSVGLHGAVHCSGAYFTHQERQAAEARGELTLPAPRTRRMHLPPALDVAAGEHHFCSLGADGSVWCWGANDYGQAGPRPTRCPETQWDDCKVDPARVPLPDRAVAIAAGERHSCAILREGRVACWGHNEGGMLGFPSEARCFPRWRGYCDAEPGIVEGVTGAIEIVATRGQWRRTWALTEDGEVLVWPNADHRYVERRSKAPTR